MIEKVLYELNLYLQNLKSYVKLKHSNRQKNTDVGIHFFETIAITGFETDNKKLLC